MDAPQNNEWGPALWQILHSLSLKINTIIPTTSNNYYNPKTYYLNEEKRLWSGLLNTLKNSLPCPLCKKHYADYLIKNPIDYNNLTNIKYWLFNLHNNVNSRLNKEVIQIDNLSTIYSNIDLKNCYNIIQIHLKRAINLQWVIREDSLKLLRFLSEMFIFYSI